MKKILFTIVAFLMLYGLAFATGSCVLTDITSTQIAAESNRIPDSFTVDVKLVERIIGRRYLVGNCTSA